MYILTYVCICLSVHVHLQYQPFVLLWVQHIWQIYGQHETTHHTAQSCPWLLEQTGGSSDCPWRGTEMLIDPSVDPSVQPNAGCDLSCLKTSSAKTPNSSASASWLTGSGERAYDVLHQAPLGVFLRFEEELL